MTYCMVLTTCGTETEAKDIGRGLVETKLAACVQIHKVESVYSWKNEIHTDPEFRLIVKTRDVLYDDVTAYITTHHAYEVPQIVKVPIVTGLAQYLTWIDDSTGAGSNGS